MSVQDELRALVKPAVEALGFEFVGLEYLSNPKNRLVRVFIDREPEGISVDDCADVSREISALLDVEDPVSGAYNLEVSSPGVERPLFEPDQYRRFIGQRVRLQLFAPVENRRKLDGTLIEADDNGAAVDVEGQLIKVAYGDIRRAHLKPDMDALLSGR